MSADPLAELLPNAVTALPEQPTAASKALKRGINYSHAAMIDMILAEPWISHNTLAERFGYTPSWISTIMATDAFKAQFAARKEELIDPALRATVEEQFEGILSRSMDIIRERLDQPAETVSDQFVLRTMELSSRSLGYGARQEQAPVQVNINQHLEGLGENLVALLRRERTKVAIEGESYEKATGSRPGSHQESGGSHSRSADGGEATSPVQPALRGEGSG